MRRPLEAVAGLAVPPRAAWLRALALERERIANHLGDLGYLGNDGGFAFGLAQFSRLKEDVLRANLAAFGHRMAMDYIVPGGVARDLDATHATSIADNARCSSARSQRCAASSTSMPACRIGSATAASSRPSSRRSSASTGLAGRASGQAFDLRCDFPSAPYDELGVRMATHDEGDVAARVAVRFDELVRIAAAGPRDRRGTAGRRPDRRRPAAAPCGAAASDGPRPRRRLARTGAALRSKAARTAAIRRCHPHDPSWTNWPVLEHAVIGNIVPDFPLINKSFNLSYSGHDL